MTIATFICRVAGFMGSAGLLLTVLPAQAQECNWGGTSTPVQVFADACRQAHGRPHGCSCDRDDGPYMAPDQAAINRGLALLDRKDYAGAEAEFRRAVALNPGNHWAHNNLGAALHGLGRYREAEAEYREALRLNPGNATARENLQSLYVDGGNALHEQRRYDDAINQYRHALELDPGDEVVKGNIANSLNGKGLDLMNQGRWDEAEAALREAMRRGSPYARDNLGRLFFRKANQLHEQQRYDEAIAADRRALEFDPNNAAAKRNIANSLNSKGVALEKQGQSGAAEQAYREAMRGGSDYARKNLAHLYLHQGNALYDKDRRYDDAIAAYRQTLQVDPGNEAAKANIASAFHNKGVELERQGKLAEAKAAYREAAAAGDTQAGKNLEKLDDYNAVLKQMTPGARTGKGRSNDTAGPAGGSTPFFGKGNSAPSAEALGPLPPPRQATRSAGSVSEQLANAVRSGEAAAATASKPLSNCQWDTTAGCPSGRPDDVVHFPRPSVQTPAALELASHLPDQEKVTKDPVIRKTLAWYDHLEKQKAGYARDLAKLRQQAEGGDGDAAQLKAKTATIENQLKRLNADQTVAVQQIKKRLANRGSAWIEQPSSSGVSQADALGRP